MTEHEQMVKMASRINARKKQGFITYLKGVGKSDQEIAEVLPKYAALDAQRTHNYFAARQAVIPE